MSSNVFHVMMKPVGSIRNLDCKYCFYLKKYNLYPNISKWAVRPEAPASYPRQYVVCIPDKLDPR